MSAGPAEWLGAWATLGGTVIAAVVAVVGAVSSRIDRRKAEKAASDAADSATRSADATERIAAAIEASEARIEAEKRVSWRAYPQPSDPSRTVFVLANEGLTAARGVRIAGTGQFAAHVHAPPEAVDIEGQAVFHFVIDTRLSMPLPDLMVTWAANPEGEVVKIV